MRVISLYVLFILFAANSLSFTANVLSTKNTVKKNGRNSSFQVDTCAISRTKWDSIAKLRSFSITRDGSNEDCIVTQPKVQHYGPHIKIKGYALNTIGLLYIISTFGAAILFYPFLVASYVFSKIFRPKTMRYVDWIVHSWSKVSCLLMTYKPQVRGVENLPPRNEAVMYIPNHCSYFDIMTLSGFLPRPFKYVSKIEVLRIPLIGWAMRMAHHIAIRRADRRSQLQTFKDTVTSLQNGNSVVTFAEGTRSSDGHLKQFKKGPFTMAKKAGIRIVPISLVNTHLMMPKDCLLPVGVPRNIVIIIHPPISTENKSENELMDLTWNAVASGLPSYQAPISIEAVSD